MSEKKYIGLYGARVHNLKNFDLKIPRNKLVIFTGKSGSGKSSLAFNTIHAEGQRRYLETFNAYARQFLGNLERPDIDKITGLSPVVAIEQKTTNKNPRSTVGTMTEIYDYLRLLYARVGVAYSYKTGEKMVKFTDKQIVNLILKDYENKSIIILSPIIRARKGHYNELFSQLCRRGYLKARVNGKIIDIYPSLKLDRYKTHDIEILIDRLMVNKLNSYRLLKSLNLAMNDGNGVAMVIETKKSSIRYFSRSLMCSFSGIAYKNPEPNTFSFNSPKGSCTACNGLGYKNEIDVLKILPDKSLCIANGGIAPFAKKKSEWFLKQLDLIGQKFNFNFSTPICDFSDDAINAILYGIEDTIKVKLKSAKISKIYKIDFEGIASFILNQSKNSNVKSIERWSKKFMKKSECKSCNGGRLNKEAMSYKVFNKKISELCQMDMFSFSKWLQNAPKKLSPREIKISKQIFNEIEKRVQFILDVGLAYLSLGRETKSLSGGEAQRIRLATQIGSKLTNVLYILDEPSIGLHQKDNLKLIDSLKKLRDIGNSVIVVEHDKDMIRSSDFIIDLGPGAGVNGGEIVSEGTLKDTLKSNSLTSSYLSGLKKIVVPKIRRKGNGKFLRLKGATGNNLKCVNLEIPLGLLCCITGVSGSGKSTLINETLFPILSEKFHKSEKTPLAYKGITGTENLDKVIKVDQSPIGRTPRSNTATYTGLFSEIRDLFSNLPESKIRGYKSGRFSFNVVGGRCENCRGAGLRTIEMNFLPDVMVDCEVCNTKRYNRETLQIKYKGKSISEILNLTVFEAVNFFENVPKIFRKVKTLKEVGLGYIKLGQSALTLSGGEAQRVKLATELSKKSTGKTLYILDEPTTGLHFDDVNDFLKVINSLVDKGNSVIIIEHNMDVIKTSDYIVDLGLDGGLSGGEIICNGSPEEIVKENIGYTSRFLKLELNE